MDRHIPAAALEEQRRVNAYFDDTTDLWSDLYARQDLRGVLYQRRRDMVLQLVDGFGLPPACRVLDAGCGPGAIALGLAQRGFRVDAIDPTRAMIDRAVRNAAENGLDDRITAKVGDVYGLPYSDSTFGLVIFIGVSDWLESLATPLREIARVLQPEGYLVANADNSWALHHVLDPATNPLGAPLKRLVRRAIQRITGREPKAHGRLRSIGEFERAIGDAGLRQMERLPLGFGPFRLFRRQILPTAASLRVNDRLQHLADRNVRILRSAAYTNVVVARKPS